MNERKVFLVGFWPDYEERAFEGVVLGKCTVSIYNPKKELSKKTLERYYPKPLKNFIYKKNIKKLVEKNASAIFIFQDSKILINYLIDEEVNSYVCLLLRNSIGSKAGLDKSVIALNRKKIPIYSFDKIDCKRFNLIYYNQFVCMSKYEPSVERYDFSFVGRDKGRRNFIDKLREAILGQGYSMKLLLVTDKKDIISYSEYLKILKESKCIIDVVQKNQQGITLRPIEAAMYRKKLLTNNPNVKSLSFFCESNILIIDENITQEKINEFMRGEPQEVPSELLQEFSAQKTLERIYINSST